MTNTLEDLDLLYNDSNSENHTIYQPKIVFDQNKTDINKHLTLNDDSNVFHIHTNQEFLKKELEDLQYNNNTYSFDTDNSLLPYVQSCQNYSLGNLTKIVIYENVYIEQIKQSDTPVIKNAETIISKTADLISLITYQVTFVLNYINAVLKNYDPIPDFPFTIVEARGLARIPTAIMRPVTTPPLLAPSSGSNLNTPRATNDNARNPSITVQSFSITNNNARQTLC
jgi:hypothetical protein